jgi:hypothetical protein
VSNKPAGTNSKLDIAINLRMANGDFTSDIFQGGDKARATQTDKTFKLIENIASMNLPSIADSETLILS